MKFALIIPTRGDRPKFIEQCKKLISRQTLQPTEVIWVDYKPESGNKDITQRYRRGVGEATKKGHQFVVFWEDDDWYHPQYLEWLISEWKKAKMPKTFGVGETYYYHHGLRGKLYYDHPGRTSAFCTLIKLPVLFNWPPDHYAFLDMHIYRTCPPITIKFPKDKIYAIGIKHGIGLSGGGGHTKKHGYKFENGNLEWFYKHVGDDRHFYDSIVKDMSLGNSDVNKITQINTTNVPKIKSSNVQTGKIITTNSNTQLHRGGTTIRKIRKR